MIRVFILLGQYGGAFSGGMYGLAKQINALSGNIVCTVHGWKDSQEIHDEIKRLPASTKIVLIGYSLGANSVTQIAAELPTREIDLLVAYDASVLQSAGIKPIGTNVDKTLCYRSTNYWLPYGHGQLVGHNVKTYETSDIHLAVCYDQVLHAKTLAEIKKLI